MSTPNPKIGAKITLGGFNREAEALYLGYLPRYGSHYADHDGILMVHPASTDGSMHPGDEWVPVSDFIEEEIIDDLLATFPGVVLA